MASKRRNMFYQNKKQETTEIGLCKLELRPKKSGQVKCRSRPPVHNCLTRFCRVDDSLPENELDLLFDDEKIFEDVLHEGEDAGPPTPTCEELSDLDELIYQSGLLLQKVIRGRAIQTMMHQGRARHQDLIDELKSTFGLLPEETEHRHAERRQVMTGTRDFTSGKNKPTRAPRYNKTKNTGNEVGNMARSDPKRVKNEGDMKRYLRPIEPKLKMASKR
ncbi:hypothetical protein AAG570_001610 [Ranatra chinensis]|uniref:Uncharacterized protein n=1 Tax=Ranatra chinensis TaxID=642074 RepID=A0ABD0YXB7_9HEMI